MRRTPASWRRTAAGSRTGAFSAVLAGAWLALTVLFTVVGVSLVGTAAATLGQPQGVLTFLVTLAGALGACAVAPTLAQGVVVASLERVAAAFDRDDDRKPTRSLLGRDEMQRQERCQTPASCCC